MKIEVGGQTPQVPFQEQQLVTPKNNNNNNNKKIHINTATTATTAITTLLCQPKKITKRTSWVTGSCAISWFCALDHGQIICLHQGAMLLVGQT